MYRLFCAETASVVRGWLKANSITFFEFILGGIFLATLTGCGGGGGGGSAPAAPAASTTTVSGQVVDGVFPGAKVSILSGSLTGTVLGTATADNNGKYTIIFPAPAGTTPIFVTATNSGGTATLASYVGPASQLNGALTDANIPNLNITQVTTSALALMQNNGVSLAALTPAQYGQQITQLNNVIIQLAGIVQDIVDQPDAGCATASGGAVNLAAVASMLGSSAVPATADLYTLVSSKLNTSCTTATMANLSGAVAGSSTLAHQLISTAATAGKGVGVPAGTYTGSILPMLTSVTPSTCSSSTPPSIPVTVTVGSTGVITLTSVMGPASFSGSLTGTNFTMSGTDPNPASITGAYVPLPSASVTGGNGFSVNGTWTDSNNGCTYSGTYNAPSLLSAGAALTTTPSVIPNGNYSVTIQPVELTCSGCTVATEVPFPATIGISNGAITFTSGSSGIGTGTITGSTFTLTIPNIGCSGTNTITATGTMSSPASGSLILNGSYSRPALSSTCPGKSGTFTGST
ncbi:MAG: hypothetical protein ACYC0M_08710 [Burkholderiales bacterium]